MRRRLHLRRRRPRRDRRRCRRVGARALRPRPRHASTSTVPPPARPTTPGSAPPARARKDCETVRAYRRRAGSQPGPHVPRDRRRRHARRAPRSTTSRSAVRAPTRCAAWAATTCCGACGRPASRRRCPTSSPPAPATTPSTAARARSGSPAAPATTSSRVASATERSPAAPATTRSGCAARGSVVVRGRRRARHDLRARRVRAAIRCGCRRDVVHVYRGDSSRATASASSARRCGACACGGGVHRARSARAPVDVAPRVAATPTYADLVATTPGLTHWWRMSPNEQIAGRLPTSRGLIDRVTKSPGRVLQQLSRWARRTTATRALRHRRARYPQAAVHVPRRHSCCSAAFTFEGWFRADDRHATRAVQRRPGRARAGVRARARSRRLAARDDLARGSDPRARRCCARRRCSSAGRWHHVALTRTDRPDRVLRRRRDRRRGARACR